MDEWLARFLTVTYPVVIVCASGLVAYWMKLRHARRLAATRDAEVARLERVVQEIRGETDGRLAELEERVDFAERLLARLPPHAELEHGATTPR